ncbi:MAG: hypothetical protein MI685_01145 [Chlorobiales bacterium]|nr:hypothetical protein [Chlorobiales bacterium]
MNNRNIDVHCHFFNAAFGFNELLEAGWRLLHGDYPYKSDELLKAKALPVTTRKRFSGISNNPHQIFH